MPVYRNYNLKKDKFDIRDLKFSALISPAKIVKLPRKVDLRSGCPAVYDQQTLGSCTANAGSTARVMLLKDTAKDLSRLYLYYKERELEGTISQDNGASMRSICKVLNKNGICEEPYMPYVISKFSAAPSPEAEVNAEKYKVTSYRSLNTLRQIKECLFLRQQPVLMGMEVYESFERIGADGKMSMPKPEERNLGGHAVLVVGYIDCMVGGSGVLIVRNSWGADWGDKGYFYMPYEFVNKGHAWDFWSIE